MREIERSVCARLIAEIERREVSIILGPRQVGKTVLLRRLERECRARGLRTNYYNL